MWILRWIVLLVVIILVLSFSLQNQGQVVDLKFMKWESGPIPLYLALFISFGLGMVAFLLIAVFQQLQTLSELSRAKRNFKKLQKQLEELHGEIESKQKEITNNEEEQARLRHNAEVLQNKLDKAIAGSKEKEIEEQDEDEKEED